jgi:hypothetical protein
MMKLLYLTLLALVGWIAGGKDATIHDVPSQFIVDSETVGRKFRLQFDEEGSQLHAVRAGLTLRSHAQSGQVLAQGLGPAS